jgi:GNAT superfamily N-acetyltransferase
MSVEVRAALPEDLPRLLDLYEQLAEGMGHHPATAGQAAAALAEISAQGPGRTLLVALLDGWVAASLDLVIVSPSLTHAGHPWAAVENVVVDAVARRRGVGRALMEEAIRRSREAGCHRVQLLSSNRRTEAHAFYRALGFETSAVGFRLHFL